MHRTARLRLALAGLIALVPAADAAQLGIQLGGTVLEAITERPIDGVFVTATSDSTTKTATTDSQGRYSIELPESGRYLITATHEGMVDARPNQLQTPHNPGIWVQVSSGGKISPITLHMQPAGVISGQVLDANGMAYPGARGTVSPLRYTYDESGKKVLTLVPGLRYGNSPTGRMDEKGNYRLFGLQPGDYYISASGGGENVFYPNTTDEALAKIVHVDAGQEVRLPLITLPTPKKVAVHFHITDSDGKPISNSASLNSLMLIYPDGSGTAASISSSSFGQAGLQQIPLPIERTLSISTGPHDFMVGLGGGPDLFYSNLHLDLGTSDVDQELHMNRGHRVTTNLMILDSEGRQMDAPKLRCRLSSDALWFSVGSAPTVCLGSSFSSGHYRLDIDGMPPDAYVASAKSGGKDILAAGFSVTENIELEIVLKTSGATLDGTVKNAAGDRMINAVVALVPDAPLRGAGVYYRSVISDVNGTYQLRGIAPGNYRLFAWSELEGAAYRNAEFMKDFYDKGLPIRIQEPHATLDVTVLN